jgi:hypothetical protein
MTGCYIRAKLVADLKLKTPFTTVGCQPPADAHEGLGAEEMSAYEAPPQVFVRSGDAFKPVQR